jgi:hypothetical protein
VCRSQIAAEEPYVALDGAFQKNLAVRRRKLSIHSQFGGASDRGYGSPGLAAWRVFFDNRFQDEYFAQVISARTFS